MTSILLTGATGFIGRHILDTLLEEDFRVVVASRSKSFSHLSNQNITEVVVGEIHGETSWSKALIDVDVVIHLAARAHILDEDSSALSAQKFQKVNTDGTINLAEQASQAGVKQFIFMSSIGAMGTLSPHVLSEDSPCVPDTPYGQSKLSAEEGLARSARNTSMSFTIIRPTLVYGPENPGNMERLIKLVQSRLPLPLGAINNKRSLIYVGNLIDAVICCINHPAATNQVFIVSDGQDLSTTELIKKIAEALEQKPRLLPIPHSILKITGRLTGKTSVIDRLIGSLSVDINKIQRHLEWRPPYSVEEGLKATCKPTAKTTDQV